MQEIRVLEGTPQSEFEDAYDDQRRLRGAILSEPLGSVPRRRALIVAATAPIADAVRAMNDQHTGCALVVRLGKLVGIFTERDILRKVVGQTIDIARTAVEHVMTPDPDTLPAGASIAFALRKMSVEGYRHIPLCTEDGRPVGVVAVRDIVAWMTSMFPEGIHNLPPEPGYPKDIDGG